jgi:2-haloacid dehalogenase
VTELVARHPTQRSLIEAYWHRWPEMISGPIVDTVRVVAELKHRGELLFGLTNWSAETFRMRVSASTSSSGSMGSSFRARRAS